MHPTLIFKWISTIDLVVNEHGGSLYKSSSTRTCPIICKFAYYPPFIVSLFCGSKKPDDSQEFLREFLHEFDVLRETGFQNGNNVFLINLHAFVCDAPARQFLKYFKSHTGCFGCERCTLEQSYALGRVVFDDIDSPFRDDESFEQALYLNTHQIHRSILTGKSIKCVTQFPLDYMPLVCFGVIKRLLLFWKEGPRQYRLLAAQLAVVSEKLKEYHGKMPSEFARQPRGLDEVKRWKATEYRQFLLYTRYLGLEGVLSPESYSHFLCLSIAFHILLENNGNIRRKYLHYARDLLRYFVSKCGDLSGSTFTVYNVHNLLHVWQDVDNFNVSLDEISSFPFKNYLQVLKKFVKKSQNPLAQVVKGVSELERFPMNGADFKNLDIAIAAREKDSWFLLSSGEFAQILDINQNSYDCRVISNTSTQNLFNDPCDSKMINVVYIRNSNNASRWREIQKKYVLRNCLFAS